jgi:hypothetical protein
VNHFLEVACLSFCIIDAREKKVKDYLAFSDVMHASDLTDMLSFFKHLFSA